MPRFSPARAYWNQRAALAAARQRIHALRDAIDRPDDLRLAQWAQVMAAAMEFRPDVIVELGRGAGNSTVAFNEALEITGGQARIVSICLSREWEDYTLRRIRPQVTDAWLARLQIEIADILAFDFDHALAGAQRVLLFWDAHGFEVAGCVLGKLLPMLAGKQHLVIMHDMSDTRYSAAESFEYGVTGIWTGNTWRGPRLKMGNIDSAVEQSISAADFTTRNHLTLDSADHSYHTELTADEQAEASAVLGDLFELQAHWFYFSLNEHPGPYYFPKFCDPYLSIVVTNRNDDHGGDLLRRTQTFVNCLLAQCKRHNVPAELIFAEWNPPGDRPRLREALRWPADPGPCQVRFVEIPSWIHKSYKNAANSPLYQMIGKNVAIRRARGRFILATNIDILFSDEVMQFLAARRLQTGRMYRMDRYDVKSDVPVNAPVDAQLEYCRNNLLRVHAAEGTFLFTPEGYRALSTDDIAGPDSGIYFGEGWFTVEREGAERFRWVGSDAKVVVTPRGGQPSSLLFELEPGPGVGSKAFQLCVLDAEGAAVGQVRVSGRSALNLQLPASASSVSFTLRVLRAGKPVPHDLRVLNFRVFRCEWGANQKLRAAYSLSCTPVTSRFVRMWQLSQQSKKALARVAASHGDVNFELPPARSFYSALRFAWQAGSFWNFGYATARWMLRRFSLSVRSRAWQDIGQPGSGIDAGTGWHELENYLGETFRWAGEMCELVIRIPLGSPRDLLLQMEIGPSASKTGLRLRAEDETGNELASICLRRIQLVAIPMAWEPGRTRVIRLRAMDGGGAVPGDSRILNFRVFWAGWSTASKSKRPDITSRPVCLLEKAEFQQGVAWGHGWSELRRDESGEVYREAADGSAEVLLRIPGGARFDLEGDLRPAQATGAAGLTMQALCEGGGPVVASRLDHNGYRFSLAVKANQTYVVRLQCLDDAGGRVAFRAYRLQRAPTGPDDRSMGRRGADVPAVSLHTNACGDFTLMAREHWFDVRAYPEWDLYSMHIDSVLCYAAHHAGAIETVLKEPMRIYHIEHSAGWTPEGVSELFERLRARNISWIEYQELVTWTAQMRRLDCPILFNRDNWGLAEMQLPETTLNEDRVAS